MDGSAKVNEGMEGWRKGMRDGGREVRKERKKVRRYKMVEIEAAVVANDKSSGQKSATHPPPL